MLVRVTVLAGVLGALLAVVGGAPAASRPHSMSHPAAHSTPAAATAVAIVLKEWSIAASTKSITAGKVTFVVRNAGKMKHEFVVMRSARHHHLLQMKGQQASEAGAKGEIEEFAAGRTKRLTLTLAPGKYVLLCNLPGHYKKGQYLAFTVKPAATTAPQTTDVNVSLFEMGFKLSKMTVPRGTVVFHLKNDGKLPHDFSFGSRGGGSPMLQAGQSATFTAKFATPGKYTFICTVEGHQESGMIGALTVT
jgi:uncharacterized cupredoxin-like copper-binding protein